MNKEQRKLLVSWRNILQALNVSGYSNLYQEDITAVADVLRTIICPKKAGMITMNSEEDIKNCTTNGVPNKYILQHILDENYKLKEKNQALRNRIKALEAQIEHLEDRIEDLYEMLTAEDEDD